MGVERVILCSSRHCIRKPTRLVDNYCIGVSLKCGYCLNSTIDYYDRQHGISQFSYPELYHQFWTEQIIEVKSIQLVEIKDRQLGPYVQYYKLTSKEKRILEGVN